LRGFDSAEGVYPAIWILGVAKGIEENLVVNKNILPTDIGLENDRCYNIIKGNDSFAKGVRGVAPVAQVW